MGGIVAVLVRGGSLFGRLGREARGGVQIVTGFLGRGRELVEVAPFASAHDEEAYGLLAQGARLLF